MTSALTLTQLHHHVRTALKYLTEVSDPQCNTASVPQSFCPSSVSSHPLLPQRLLSPPLSVL